MSDSTLTFELGGKVDIKTLAEGIGAFHLLIAALTPKDSAINWVVENLHAGSATATLRGEARDSSVTRGALPTAENVVSQFTAIGRDLSEHVDLSTKYNSGVQTAVRAIEQLITAVEYVRFETRHAEHTIYKNGKGPKRSVALISMGEITGIVQTLSNRSGLQFRLYDSIYDRPVSCYLEPGQEDDIRGIWGRRARVTGTITRNGVTGLPTSIRNILQIEPLPDPVPGTYKEARGALPWTSGSVTAEKTIRELRDGW